jgi:ribosomal protein S12 methylthiotransferase
MAGQVPKSVRRERLERLMDVQRDITLEKNEARVGTRVSVLIDERTEEGALARAPWQAPEVDGVVEIDEPGAAGPETLRPGSFVEVEITGATELDLTARVVA